MKKLFYILFIFMISCSQKSDSQKNEIAEPSNTPDVKAVAAPAEPIKVEEPQYDTWTFDRVDGTKLVFKEGPSFDTELVNLEYIGQIETDQKAPFFIYSGRDCDECDANTAIYFHSPRHGQLNVGNGENRYGYPGRERDYETDSLIYQARAFYGEVLKGVKGIVWYQKTLMEDNSFQNSVFIARIDRETIKGEEIKGYDRKLQETLSLNKSGKNKEIKGRDYTSEP
jgi:hypothetical protein